MNPRAARLSYGLAIAVLYLPYTGLWPQLADMPGLSSRQATLLARTLADAGVVALAATLLGFVAALDLWRRPAGAQRWARRVLLLLVALPTYFHAAAWQPLVEGHGGVVATMVCQTMGVLPLATALGWLTIQTAVGQWLDAGWQMRSAGAALSSLVLPRCRLGLTACAGLLAAMLLTDHTIPSLCGVATFAEEVMAQYSAGAVTARALAVAWPLAALAVVLLAPLAAQAAGEQPRPDSQLPPRPPRWPWPVELATGLGLAALALNLLVPLRQHVLTVGSWSAWWDGCAACAESLLTSLGVAFGAATLAVVLGLALMEFLAAGRGRRGALAWELALVGLGLPPALLGIGLIDAFNRLWASPIYGTVVMSMLASGLRWTPVAAVCLALARRQLDPQALEAGRLAGQGGWRGWFGLELAMLRPAIGAAAGLVFAFSIGELGATLLVVPPGQGTLALRLFGLLHYGASAEAAAGCLLLWLTLLPLLWTVEKLLSPRRRSPAS